MTFVVYAAASRGSYPGHMVIGQEGPGDACRYFGYRFDPATLPDDFQPQERWLNYLLDHAVPGMITDETEYITYLLAMSDAPFYYKRGECAVLVETKVPPNHEWEPHAWYSFNPDSLHHNQPCYNCVKWAIMIANQLVVNFLPTVPQSQVSRILPYLFPHHHNGET